MNNCIAIEKLKTIVWTFKINISKNIKLPKTKVKCKNNMEHILNICNFHHQSSLAS